SGPKRTHRQFHIDWRIIPAAVLDGSRFGRSRNRAQGVWDVVWPVVRSAPESAANRARPLFVQTALLSEPCRTVLDSYRQKSHACGCCRSGSNIFHALPKRIPTGYKRKPLEVQTGTV